jgi:ABC-type branched-subunit amino acid transport system permease subunit
MDTKGDEGIEPRTLKILPYRWGYFQGVLVIPFSLLMLLGSASDLRRTHHHPWYLTLIGLLTGLVGLPLGVGLLQKKKYALSLVYAMFALAFLQAAIQLPIATLHYADQSDNGSAFFEAWTLLLWLLSMVYYRKRREQLS